MWVDKNHPNVIYGDIREEPKGHIPEQVNHHIAPDIVLDFQDLPFDDESFKLVVFDPPHLKKKQASPKSIIGKKFGWLSNENWEPIIKKGFDECWRVLEPYGILIFKWNDTNHPYSYVLNVIGRKPLFQNIMRRKSAQYGTYWACFMKIPNSDKNED